MYNINNPLDDILIITILVLTVSSRTKYNNNHEGKLDNILLIRSNGIFILYYYYCNIISYILHSTSYEL